MTNEERFRRFDENNPALYLRLRAMAIELARSGRRRYSVKTLWEVLRWRNDLIRDPRERWKLNNSYTAFYSRELMAREPELAGFFETREKRK
jgi:hypothetical protein